MRLILAIGTLCFICLILGSTFAGSAAPPIAVNQDALPTLDQTQYVGSKKCESCHRQIYHRWIQTPMANVVRDPVKFPRAIIPDLTTNNIAPFTKDQVTLVYGSIWKQRYFTRIGDDLYPLPAQWEIAHRSWSRYFVEQGKDWWAAAYPPDNMKRPTSSTCDGCHSVAFDIVTKKPVEWNVGCERCHGPGSVHCKRPTRSNILNPARMDQIASNDTCIQCHSQGRPLTESIAGKAYDWPVGYEVGKRLQDYWKLEPEHLGSTSFCYFADGTAHKNRMQGNDFVQSVMYRHGITCASCHDAHGTGNYAQLRKPAETICLTCHHGVGAPNGPHTATIFAHTHHKDGTPGSRCVDCHMPAIETEGVPGALVHAHTFRFVSPSLTEQHGIPNPCTGCHKSRSTAWAMQALSRWKEVSPWRMEWPGAAADPPPIRPPSVTRVSPTND